MGGGSSDAGAVLRRLNGHFKALPENELARLALTLGADVPFFLYPHVSVATGVGEVFRPVEGMVSPPPLLVVNPNFPVSAKWAYTHLDPARIGNGGREKLEKLVWGLREGDAAMVAGNLHNDLAFALYEKFPLLRMLRDTMKEAGALNAEITGSGPTLYAVCETVEIRRQVAQRVRERFAKETATVFENIPLSPIK